MTQFLHRFRVAFAALLLAAILPAAAMADPGYDNPIRITYSYPLLDWHSGAITKYVQGPTGKLGVISSILVVPTTAFVGTSTPANIEVGYSGHLTAYATVVMGTTSVPSPVSVPIMFSTYASGLTQRAPPPPAWSYMAANTPVIFTFNPGTGGSVAGVADVFVTIDWF